MQITVSRQFRIQYRWIFAPEIGRLFSIASLDIFTVKVTQNYTHRYLTKGYT